jgi:hypothetical protein
VIARRLQTASPSRRIRPAGILTVKGWGMRGEASFAPILSSTGILSRMFQLRGATSFVGLLRWNGRNGALRWRDGGLNHDLHLVIDAERIQEAPIGPDAEVAAFECHLPRDATSPAVDDGKAHRKSLRSAVQIQLNARREMAGVFHLDALYQDRRGRVLINIEEFGAAEMPVTRAVPCVEAAQVDHHCDAAALGVLLIDCRVGNVPSPKLTFRRPNRHVTPKTDGSGRRIVSSGSDPAQE